MQKLFYFLESNLLTLSINYFENIILLKGNFVNDAPARFFPHCVFMVADSFVFVYENKKTEKKLFLGFIQNIYDMKAIHIMEHIY